MHIQPLSIPHANILQVNHTVAPLSKGEQRGDGTQSHGVTQLDMELFGQISNFCQAPYPNHPPKLKLSWAVVAHAFNPSTGESEAGGFLSSSPAWSTEWVPEWTELDRKTLSWGCGVGVLVLKLKPRTVCCPVFLSFPTSAAWEIYNGLCWDGGVSGCWTLISSALHYIPNLSKHLRMTCICVTDKSKGLLCMGWFSATLLDTFSLLWQNTMTKSIFQKKASGLWFQMALRLRGRGNNRWQEQEAYQPHQSHRNISTQEAERQRGSEDKIYIVTAGPWWLTSLSKAPLSKNFISSPHSITSQGPGVQVREPVRDINHSNHNSH